MKKSLLFLATAALFASCADDLLEPNNGFQASNEKGITFQVVDDATRGMIDQSTFKANFFAEQDEINIWSDNALKGNNAMTGFTTAVIYKATKSVGDPNFTGVSADDILSFKPFSSDKDADNTAKFFVAYPKGQAVSHTFKDNVRTFAVTPAIDLMNQTMSKGYMDMDKRLMYDYAEVTRTGNESILEQNQSLGDKVQLKLITPMTAAFFKIEDIMNYIDDKGCQFGKLKTVTLTSEYSPLVPAKSGQVLTVKAEDLVEIEEVKYFKNELNYEIKDGKVVYSVPVDKDNKPTVTTRTAGDKVSISTDDNIEFQIANGKKTATWKKVAPAIVKSAKLSYGAEGTGAAIDANTVMNLYILPTTGHTNKAETYTVVYEFEKATFTFNIKKDYDFDVNGAKFYSKITDLPCVVTNESTSEANDRSLIINSGSLSDILVKDDKGNVKDYDDKVEGVQCKVKWGAEEIAPTEFENITINTKVLETEWAYLNTFTNAKTLKLLGKECVTLGKIAGMTSLTSIDAPCVTTVAKDAFGKEQNEKLGSLSLPAVTSFGAQADFKFSNLHFLYLNSYDNFGGKDEVAPGVFFNTFTAGTLNIINLASVASLRDSWERESKISFEKYTVLTEITLKNNVKINSYQFKDCEALKKVTGVLDISTAEYAFQNCVALTTVQIKDTGIPAGAFKSSAVATITDKDKKTVVLTSIGKEAFMSNTAIKTMDLSKATTIGESAFDGATNFTGTDAGLATLAVSVVEKDAFNGTAIVRFLLNEALQTKSGSLNSSKVKQIKYVKDLNKIDGKSPIDKDQVAETKRPSVSIYVASEDDYAFFEGHGYSQVEK